MKRVKTTVSFVLVMTVLLAAAASACGKESKSGTLKVGVRDDVMNLGYLNPTTGQYYGMEIDLARLLAEDLGYAEAEFVTVKPDTRKDMLLNGDVDCLIAAYSISETRLENFDFSPAYYSDYTRIMVEKTSMIGSIEELVGKKIGVLDGANTAPELAQKMTGMGLITAEDPKGTSLLKKGTYAELSQALEEGTADAVCMDGCIAIAYMNDDRAFLEDTIYQEDYGVATQKDSKLSKPVAKSIQKMLDDGTIAKLIDKWD